MPKLDLRGAIRIKTASGDAWRLKGDGFDWTHPLIRLRDLCATLPTASLHVVGLSPAWQDFGQTLPAGVGDPVRVLEDLSGNGHHWIATTDEARPIRVAPGRLAFDGVDQHMQMPSLTPALAKFLHDGTGATIAMLAGSMPTQANQYGMFSTARLATQPGVSFALSSGGTEIWFSIRNGVDSPVSLPMGSTYEGLAAGIWVVEHASASSPNLYWMSPAYPGAVYSDNYVAAPTSANASWSPFLGRNQLSGQHLEMQWSGSCLLPATGNLALVRYALAPFMPDKTT